MNLKRATSKGRNEQLFMNIRVFLVFFTILRFVNVKRIFTGKRPGRWLGTGDCQATFSFVPKESAGVYTLNVSVLFVPFAEPSFRPDDPGTWFKQNAFALYDSLQTPQSEPDPKVQ